MNSFAVEAERLTKAYGTVVAVQDVSFAVPDGAFVAVIGPNGAGKSTLLNLVLGFEAPDRGSVRVFGAPPAALPADRLGYVPQLKTIDRSFPAVALELVVSGLRRGWPWRIRASERATAVEAMERTGVSHLAERPISALSGGELQRAYLARCLARRPSFLVLDEPAAGIDVAGEAAMYHVLMDYQRESGATILMITHDWEGARCHASHVLLLDAELLGFGPPAEIATDDRLLHVFGHAGHVRRSHPETASA